MDSYYGIHSERKILYPDGVLKYIQRKRRNPIGFRLFHILTISPRRSTSRAIITSSSVGITIILLESVGS